MVVYFIGPEAANLTAHAVRMDGAMEKTRVVINLESKYESPALPDYIVGWKVAWKTVENVKATHGKTYIGETYVYCELGAIEDIAEELYRLARRHAQDCVAMWVEGNANWSRTVGPYAHLWPYDDDKVLIPEYN